MCKYNHIENIPAKVFFKILDTKDFQQLKPKPREKDLDKIFMSIYDDYFLRLDNPTAKEYLRLRAVLIENAYKIDVLKQALAFHYYTTTTKEMRMEFISAVKIGYGIEIDPEQPFYDEVKRVLDLEIGIMENEIVITQAQMREINPNPEINKMDFYDKIIEMANQLKGNIMIQEDMTLAVFVALEKNIEKMNQKND